MKNWYGKKVVSALVSLTLVLSLMPGIAMAENTETDNLDVVEEIVIPGVLTAADIVEASEDEAEADSVEEETPEEISEEQAEETIQDDIPVLEDTVDEQDNETIEAEPEEPTVEDIEEQQEEVAEAFNDIEETVELNGEEAILVKYIGSTDMSEDEIYGIVDNMDYDEAEKAYNEIMSYAKTFTEDTVVSDEFCCLAGALEQALSTSLFGDGTINVLEGKVGVSYSGSEAGGSETSTGVSITTSGKSAENKATVTITNNSGKGGIISFNYSISNKKTFTIQGESVSSTSGTYSAELGAGESVTVVFGNATSWLSTKTATLQITNFSLTEVAGTRKVTFVYDSSLGSLTIGGNTFASGESVDVDIATGITAVATPKSGVSFIGWTNDVTGEFIKSDADTTITPPENNMTYRAIFVGTNAIFGIGSGYVFDDLNKAATAALSNSSKIVYLKNNGTLAAGTYTIPAGVTLLIPFDADNHCYTTKPSAVAKDLTGILNLGKDYIDGDYTVPTPYRTLTMENGANLVINGSLSVSNRIFSGNAGMRAGSPTGPISIRKMDGGSNITVNNGGAAYVYGYIYGTGNVNFKSGSTVYESMQILDFRGGDATTDMSQQTNTGVFPFTQYYVQNIEVPATYEGGAKEYVVSALTISKMLNVAAVPFIGTSGAMFVPKTGTTFTKQFIPSTGRLQVDLNGEVSMSPLTVTLGEGLTKTTIDTKDFVLPVASSITINVNSGTIYISQNVALLPSAEINIAEDATLEVADGYAAYAYDLDEWKDKGFVYKRNTGFSDGNQSWLTKTATTTSTKLTLGDCKIDVNGKILGKGMIYTTDGGACVTSSKGTGEVELINWDTSENPITYQGYQTSVDGDQVVEYKEIPITMVKLKNADGTYTETVNVAAGITPITGKYLYENGKWSEWRPGIYFDANGGQGTMAPQYSDLETEITLNANIFTREGYNFIGWSNTPDGEVEFSDKGVVGVIDEEITLYAVWEEAACEHKNTEPAVEAEEPTCCEPGVTAGLKCSDCQETLVEPEEIPADPNAHSFTSYTYNNDAKCGVDGTKTAICDNGCETTDTVTAEGTALSHSFTSYTYNNDAKCGVNGTKTATCDHGCGATDTVVAEGTALSHSFATYVSDNNATATDYGTRTASCDHGCGTKDTVKDTGTIILTRVEGTEGISLNTSVEGYKGVGRLFVAVYSSTGRLLSARFSSINQENAVTVNFGNVDGASYAKAFAWDSFDKPIADYENFEF